MRRRPVFAEDQLAVVWPAWLFSTALHATALVLAAFLGAEFLRGGFTPKASPSAGQLQLQLADAADATPEEEMADVATPGPPVVEAVAEPAPVAPSPAPEAPPADSPRVEPDDRVPAEQPRDDRPRSVLGLDAILAEPASAPSAAAPAAGGGRAGHFRVGQLGGKATLRIFGVEGCGSKFVFLFDRSTSMAGAPLAAAQQQLLGNLDALSSVHQFHVIFFNHQISAWSGADGNGRIAFATDRNKQLASDFVRGMTAHGGTYRLDALHQALRLTPDVVFFLTDADDTMSAVDVNEAIERAGRSGCAIACIEFGTGPGTGRENFLTELARGTGGQYGYVNVQRLGR